MRILITGGAGFIGSHLTDRLLRAGASVDVLDDLSTGARANLAAALGRPGFRFHAGSVVEPEPLTALMAECDVVVHLAASVGMDLVVGDPRASIENNVSGVQALFRAAGRSGRPVLFASSSEVYGPRAAVPFQEDAPLSLGPPTSSRWSYASAKALGEFLAVAHARATGAPVVVARLFNTVGPRQRGRYGMVLPRFCRQARAGDPITVHGSGEQTRCFAHVSDTVEALTRLVQGPLSEATGAAHVVNVGSDEEISIDALARLVRTAAESGSAITRVPHAEVYGADFEDVARRVPHLGRLEAATGFRPQTPIAQTVADTLAALGQVPAAATVSGERG